MIQRKSCKGCIYHRKISCMNNTKTFACHYCSDTGKLRECKPEVCDKKDTNVEHRITDKSNFAEWCAKNNGKN